MPKAKSLEVGKKILLRTTGCGLLIVVCLVLFSLNLSDQFISATSIGEEFVSVEAYAKGTVVSLDKENPENITLANTTNSDYLLGPIVDSGDNSVTFAKAGEVVTVALSGDVSVLVSDVNGVIKKGDFISASWLEGIGMKSVEENNQKLLGVALEDFNTDSSVNYGAVDTPMGQKIAKVGSISVRLFDKEGPLAGETSSEGVEGWLEKIAGKKVSFSKIMAGSLVFLVSLVTASMFILSSIKGSFVSIGRNPLASTSIYKNLLQVSGLSVLVILLGTAISYVVLVI